MSDGSWIGLREPWERLRWARVAWQRGRAAPETARSAAESMAMQENTYSAYERPPGDGRKNTPLDHQRAIRFADKFKTNWIWLLTGEETPFHRTVSQIRAVELMAAAPEADQERVVDLIEVALRRRA